MGPGPHLKGSRAPCDTEATVHVGAQVGGGISVTAGELEHDVAPDTLARHRLANMGSSGRRPARRRCSGGCVSLDGQDLEPDSAARRVDLRDLAAAKTDDRSADGRGD